MHLLIRAAAIGLIAATASAAALIQDDVGRGISSSSGRGSADTRPIGLRVSFNRAEPVYAIGEQLGLTITTDRDAIIEIWELDAAGTLNKIVPARGQTVAVGPGRPLRLPAAGQNFTLGPPAGTTELHVIARSAPDTSRSIDSADARLPGRAGREDVKLSYRIVAR
jgi:hypothetical protein